MSWKSPRISFLLILCEPCQLCDTWLAWCISLLKLMDMMWLVSAEKLARDRNKKTHIHYHLKYNESPARQCQTKSIIIYTARDRVEQNGKIGQRKNVLFLCCFLKTNDCFLSKSLNLPPFSIFGKKMSEKHSATAPPYGGNSS